MNKDEQHQMTMVTFFCPTNKKSKNNCGICEQATARPHQDETRLGKDEQSTDHFSLCTTKGKTRNRTIVVICEEENYCSEMN